MNFQTIDSARGSSRFMHAVYGWMAAGLTLTAAVAHGLFEQRTILMQLLRHSWVFYLIAFAPIALVMYLSVRLQQMSVTSARVAFLAYAALMGMSLSTLFLVFTMSSLALCFGVAAGMFGVMAVYGYVTKADLSTLGSVMTMGLVGIVIASLINIFLRSPMMHFVVSFIGVLVFCGLTAYDMNRIKQLAADARYSYDQAGQSKLAIMCALTLYLDFINLFLFLVNLLGRRRD